jgi:CRP-like cAMP-binding protein
VKRPLDLFIKRLQLRNSLTQEECDALRAIEPVQSSKGARWDIVRSGDHTDFACLVDQGIIGRADQFADGSRRTAAFYIAGDMCDLHSVAVPVAGWNITALTDCTYYQVAHEDLLAVCDRHPRLLKAFWRDTIADASVLSKWVTVLSGLSTKQRVAHLLCEFGIRTAAAGLGSSSAFPFPLTQAQLAELVGATSVHVGRVLSELRQQGVVRPRRGHVEISDMATLRRVAEYDPTYLLLDEDIQQMLV